MANRDVVKSGRLTARGAARKKELLRVAERVFLQRGFADTTMQMIATEARASKETLYRHFLSKEGLLSEIVHNRAINLFGPSGALEVDASPADVLFGLGFNILKAITRPDSLALCRVVIAETPRAPELGRVFYSQGPAHVQARLTDYLAAATARRRLDCADPSSACRLFLGAVIASHQMLALTTSPSERPTEAAIRGHVGDAVALFMARYGFSRSERTPRLSLVEDAGRTEP